MKGGKPKTVDELKKNGSYEPAKHANRGDIPAVSGEPTPPEDFTERHLKWWAHFIKDVKVFGPLSEPHLNAVALLCRLTVEREDLQSEIDSMGHTFKTDSGQVKINPAFSARVQVDNQLIKLYEQFGFTLRSSMTIKVEKPKPASKVLEMMQGGKKKAI